MRSLGCIESGYDRIPRAGECTENDGTEGFIIDWRSESSCVGPFGTHASYELSEVLTIRIQDVSEITICIDNGDLRSDLIGVFVQFPGISSSSANVNAKPHRVVGVVNQ